MPMSPGIRKFALAVHLTSSVGWLGAVAAFVALAVAGLRSPDAQTVRAAYLGMEIMTWAVILPLSIASPASGIVQSLGTSWGLVRHYWVVAKLVMTIPATLILFLHMRPIGALAEAASRGPLGPSEHTDLRVQLVANAAAAVMVLLVTTTLSVYKPRGRTPWRLTPARVAGGASSGGEVADRAPVWVRGFGYLLAALVLTVIIKHLLGGGMGRHG